MMKPVTTAGGRPAMSPGHGIRFMVMVAGGGSLDAARRRLKCGRCGKKEGRVVVLGPV